MKKIICVLLVCVLFVSLLCGCSNVSGSVPAADSGSVSAADIKNTVKGEIVAKVVLSSALKIYYYRDILTDVMYMISDDYRAGGLSLMYHPDGSPLLYSEWLDMVAASASD